MGDHAVIYNGTLVTSALTMESLSEKTTQSNYDIIINNLIIAGNVISYQLYRITH